MQYNILGRGVPNQLMSKNNQAMAIDHQLLPDPLDAVTHMESLGSRLTLFSPFGIDPLSERQDLISQRESMFYTRFPEFGPFFYNAVNGNYSLFREGLLHLMDISLQLECNL